MHRLTGKKRGGVTWLAAAAVSIVAGLLPTAAARGEGLVGAGGGTDGGTTSGTYVAVSGAGNASSSQGIAVSGGSTASGGKAAVSKGSATSTGGSAVGATGGTCGGTVAVTATGAQTCSSGVVVSGANNATATCKAVSGTVCIGGIAASGLGAATATNTCLAGTVAGQNVACGFATAVAGGGDANAMGECTATLPSVSPVYENGPTQVGYSGNTTCLDVAASALGDADASLVSASTYVVDTWEPVPIPTTIGFTLPVSPGFILDAANTAVPLLTVTAERLQNGAVYRGATVLATALCLALTPTTCINQPDPATVSTAATCGAATVIDLRPVSDCMPYYTAQEATYIRDQDTCEGCGPSNWLYWQRKNSRYNDYRDDLVSAHRTYSFASERLRSIHAHGTLIRAWKRPKCHTVKAYSDGDQVASDHDTRYNTNTTRIMYATTEDPRVAGNQWTMYAPLKRTWTTASGHTYNDGGFTWLGSTPS